MKVYIVTENYADYSESSTEILGVYYDQALAIQMSMGYDMAYELLCQEPRRCNDYNCFSWDVEEWEVE